MIDPKKFVKQSTLAQAAGVDTSYIWKNPGKFAAYADELADGTKIYNLECCLEILNKRAKKGRPKKSKD